MLAEELLELEELLEEKLDELVEAIADQGCEDDEEADVSNEAEDCEKEDEGG